MPFDIDALRIFVLHYPASPSIRRLRLLLFDHYRYEEDYEAIYQFITDLGGVIE